MYNSKYRSWTLFKGTTNHNHNILWYSPYLNAKPNFLDRKFLIHYILSTIMNLKKESVQIKCLILHDPSVYIVLINFFSTKIYLITLNNFLP